MKSSKLAFRAALVTIVVTPALLLGPAAEADSHKIKDPVGDGPKPVDITSFKAANGKKATVFTVRFRSLRIKKLGAVLVEARTRDKNVSYLAGYGRGNRGKLQTRFYKSVDKLAKVKKCKGVKVKKPRNKISLVVPQKCYGRYAGAMRFRVVAGLAGKDKADLTGLTKKLKRG